ncbi:MAG: His/Gly/Thr/Pro-type tRNA ligase C-terminal domain-containing protein [Candidatus Woesebacteria bacterium]|nr:His/Gly/Thr/Pro-type tRNA ligase C-terminal domain-containing protein [Candidatus Woesebacteria bacterium]
MKSFFAKLGIPILILERPRINKRLQEYSEKRIEAITMTKDRRVVILANIYDLGIIFSKVYGIFYNSKEDNKENYALTSAIGLSGRVLAVLLALNGDEKGFVLSPNIAPIKVAIIPISDKPPVNKMVRKITSELKKIMITSRVFFVTSSLSERRKKIQAMGVPFIIEVGERELKSSQISLKVRSDLNSVQTQIEKLGETVRDQHSVFSKYLESKAKNEFESLNRMANSKKEFLDLAKEEFLIKSLFCDNPGCYTKIIGYSKMEILGSAYGKFSEGKSKCLVCGKAATQTIYYGIKWKGEK